MGSERRNFHCEQCGNNAICTFRVSDKTEEEIIARCATANGWIRTEKYEEVIRGIRRREADNDS